MGKGSGKAIARITLLGLLPGTLAGVPVQIRASRPVLDGIPIEQGLYLSKTDVAAALVEAGENGFGFLWRCEGDKERFAEITLGEQFDLDAPKRGIIPDDLLVLFVSGLPEKLAVKAIRESGEVTVEIVVSMADQVLDKELVVSYPNNGFAVLP